MASPYLNHLIHIAKTELPQLTHDITNSSTIYTVQDAAKRLLNIVTYLVHHVVLSDPSVAAAQAAAARAAATPTLPPPPAGFRYVRGGDGKIYMESIPVSAVPAAVPVGHAPATDHFPSQAHTQPAPMPPPAFGLPPLSQPGAAPADGASPVMEVTITPQGSRVAVPGHPVMVAPPGTPIDAAALTGPRYPGASGIPMAPAVGVPVPVAAVPAAPGQPAEVVVADGMTPEVAAALAGRSTGEPLMDASGGARNVTNEP